jgi:hypothetical protein
MFLLAIVTQPMDLLFDPGGDLIELGNIESVRGDAVALGGVRRDEVGQLVCATADDYKALSFGQELLGESQAKATGGADNEDFGERERHVEGVRCFLSTGRLR